MSDKIEITPEYEEIIREINRGTSCLLISGKAGVGKTTLLKFMTRYFEKQKKNLALVAPTGIAALQAEGSTINSFFRFPPRILELSNVKRPKDPTMYKQLHILFIDEISMTRPDTIDAMDYFLRRVRGNNKPFGGVQVVFIGDLFQLAPVVTGTDKLLLEQMGYKEHYFFNAKLFNKVNIKNIELTKIFRQKDILFTKILNKVRVGENSERVVEILNQKCYLPQKQPHELAITLATTNAIAEGKNSAELERLPGEKKVYLGTFAGDFKMTGSNLPSPEELALKVGAVVMFTANDREPEKRWVNGMLGKVKAIHKHSVDVETEAGEVFNVEPIDWKSYDYVMKDGKISQKETGKYIQIPLTLGWAITIHKSQGKTLNHLHIDLGNAAFATGQTYVALSRATNLENMTFARPIRVSDIKCCPIVKAYFNPSRPEFELS